MNFRSDPTISRSVLFVFLSQSSGSSLPFFYVKSTSQQASTSLSNCMKTQEKWERNVNTYDQCPSISSNACHAHHTYYYYLPLYKFKNDEEYAHTGISMESSIQPIVNKFFSDNNEYWTEKLLEGWYMMPSWRMEMRWIMWVLVGEV